MTYSKPVNSPYQTLVALSSKPEVRQFLDSETGTYT